MTRTTAAPATFPVLVEAVATGEGRLACTIEAGMRTPFTDSWQLATDEPKVQGGAGTAPPPLVLLSAALASCLSVQVRSLARKRRVDLPDVRVDVSIDWTGHYTETFYKAEGTAVAATIRFESDDPPSAWRDHVAEALDGCFVEALLSPRLNLVHRVATRAGEIAL